MSCTHIFLLQDKEVHVFYCVACKPEGTVSRLVDDNWIHCAYSFMKSMNPFDCVIDKTLGNSRPCTEGPIYFGCEDLEITTPYWTEGNIEKMLGKKSKGKIKGWKNTYIKFSSDQLDSKA
jgi:hypothetical protein